MSLSASTSSDVITSVPVLPFMLSMIFTELLTIFSSLLDSSDNFSLDTLDIEF